MPRLNLLRGTLDMLQVLSGGPMHGGGIPQRLQLLSKNTRPVEESSMYPAKYRIEHKGWITAAWDVSKNNRKARFYQLTSVLSRLRALFHRHRLQREMLEEMRLHLEVLRDLIINNVMTPVESRRAP